ncbi:hypothetical protein ABEB36_014608 [Hypothenemus hampei]|uniref:Uncharacterized protein n=1 Tax=Hypothenemus hampei TaxID=57062 RepID=A0ABD1E2A9_HYPHA
MQRSGIPKSKSDTRVDAGNTPGEVKSENKSSKKKSESKKTIEFQLPPLSIVGKKKEIDFDLIRKRVINRGNPEGEDKKQLASILKHLKESKVKIRVHEFVNSVSKFTCDNGEVMRKVMEDDLASFRKIVTKVYENMTQDISDVLVNEQIQTAEFYQERHVIFNNKLLWMISEILQMIPNFDFERYFKDKSYLQQICPIPEIFERNAEDVDIEKRQEAFHRLQWLKIEEGRLAKENKRLEERLDKLREQHKKEMALVEMKSQIMEQTMHELEEEEQEKQGHLNELENVLGTNIVRTEAYIRLVEDEASRLAKPLPREKIIKKSKKKHDHDQWPVTTASYIEERANQKFVESEGAFANERKRIRRREREPGRNTTLFGDQFGHVMEYSEFPSARPMKEKSIQRTTTMIQEKRPPRSRSPSACDGGCSG